MPVYPCRHATCVNYVERPGTWCQEHAADGAAALAERNARRAAYHASYDQHQRDPVAKAFYNSAGWERARATKLATTPVCERCRITFAQHVHHEIPLASCPPEEKLAQSNLVSLCQPCHAAVEAERRAGGTA